MFVSHYNGTAIKANFAIYTKDKIKQSEILDLVEFDLESKYSEDVDCIFAFCQSESEIDELETKIPKEKIIAFKLDDYSILQCAEIINTMLELISEPGIINVDFADIRSMFLGRKWIKYYCFSIKNGLNFNFPNDTWLKSNKEIILVNFSSANDLEFPYGSDMIMEYIEERVGETLNIGLGMSTSVNSDLDEEVIISIFAY